MRKLTGKPKRPIGVWIHLTNGDMGQVYFKQYWRNSDNLPGWFKVTSAKDWIYTPKRDVYEWKFLWKD